MAKNEMKIDYNLFKKSMGCSSCDHEYAIRRRRLDEEQTDEQMCTDLKMVSAQTLESNAPSLAPSFFFAGSGGSASGTAWNEGDGVYVTGPTDFQSSESDKELLGQSSAEEAQATNEAQLTNETLPNRSRTAEPTVSPSSKPSESDYVVSPEVEFPEAEEDYPSSTPVIAISTACIVPFVAYWLN